jgi:catalase
VRSIEIGLTAAVVLALACVAAPVTRAEDGAPLGEQIVDTMNQLWGRHPGLRANHTKGLVVEGSFTPSGAGAGLTKAALFRGAPTPVTVRFSNATGLPDLADGAPNANPHGMAVRFHLPEGEMDIVANSLDFFPVATGPEFRDLLQAAAASGPGASKPTKLEVFVADHPTVARAAASARTPASFARETYNGVNAFVFVDAAGQRRPFRFRLTPVAGEAHLSKEEAAKQPPDFLIDGLMAELAREPVSFRLLAQLAAPGDPTADATQPWPEDRELVDLGEITLTKAAADSAAAAKDLLFLPSNLTDGIEPSDDPLIGVRDEAYAVSFGRRSP